MLENWFNHQKKFGFFFVGLDQMGRPPKLVKSVRGLLL